MREQSHSASHALVKPSERCEARFSSSTHLSLLHLTREPSFRPELLVMPATLPLELQLHILELALPPFILSRLNERIRLCHTFSLVHRTWTQTAQRELHENVSCTDDKSIFRFACASNERWPLKRFHFHLDDLQSCPNYTFNCPRLVIRLSQAELSRSCGSRA